MAGTRSNATSNTSFSVCQVSNRVRFTEMMAAVAPPAFSRRPRSLGAAPHEMKLRVQSPWFEAIASGHKIVEGRLYTDKLAAMKKGDPLIFSKSAGRQEPGAPRLPEQSVVVIVTDVKKYPSFEAMLKTETLARALPGITTVEKGIEVYRQFYTPEDEAKLGVAAITFSGVKPVAAKPLSARKTLRVPALGAAPGILAPKPAIVAKVATLKAALPVAVAVAKVASLAAAKASVKKAATLKKVVSIKKSLQKAVAAVAAAPAPLAPKGLAARSRSRSRARTSRATRGRATRSRCTRKRNARR